MAAPFHIPNNTVGAPVSPHQYLALVLLCVFDNRQPNMYGLNLILVVMFISLTNSDIKHLFMCPLSIYMSAVDRCYCLLPIFHLGHLFFLCLFVCLIRSHKSTLYILEKSPSSDRWFENFSPMLSAADSFCWLFSLLFSFQISNLIKTAITAASSEHGPDFDNEILDIQLIP